jgi:hypothetical protein
LKRDLDIVREILLAVEHSSYPPPNPLTLPGRSEDEINYHLALMLQAGLIEGFESKTISANLPRVRVTKLTWEGHEFLEAARDDSSWNKAKAKAASTAGGLTFEVIKAFLIDLARRSVLGP